MQVPFSKDHKLQLFQSTTREEIEWIEATPFTATVFLHEFKLAPVPHIKCVVFSEIDYLAQVVSMNIEGLLSGTINNRLVSGLWDYEIVHGYYSLVYLEKHFSSTTLTFLQQTSLYRLLFADTLKRLLAHLQQDKTNDRLKQEYLGLQDEITKIIRKNGHSIDVKRVIIQEILELV